MVHGTERRRRARGPRYGRTYGVPGWWWAAAAVLLAPSLSGCGDAPAGPLQEEPRWVTLVPDSVRLAHIGERARFQVRVGRDPELRSGGVVKWISTDTAVFTVDADGEVTARGNGLAELVAELQPHVLDRAPVRVEQRAAVLEVVGGGRARVRAWRCRSRWVCVCSMRGARW